MRYWDTVDPATLSDLEREFAAVWTALPKVVLSTTLTQVEGSYALARGALAEEVERWKAEPGEGNVGVGGAALAHEAARLGLLDAYRVRVHPVLVGGGTPFFPQDGRRVDLELVESRTFASQVVFLHHRVKR
jgi:dihydrofolate reductase